MGTTVVCKEETTILIIEDEARIRIALDYHLKADGFKLRFVEDGSRAIDLACEAMPDLVLCDWLVAGRSGLQILSDLKHDPGTSHLPVFMFTAKSVEEDIEQAYVRGADGCFTKPFEPAKLGGLLRQKTNSYAGC